MPRVPSMAARRQLGLELRRLRGGRLGAEIAAALGWSESKLSRIETARTGISDGDFDRLLDVLAVPGGERGVLRELLRQARTRVWWHAYRSAVPDPYGEYVALEAESVTMHEWEAQVVPGLLQTDEYARAVIEAGPELSDPDVVQQRVALRMARQSVLTRQPPPQIAVVLDEGVLRREVGGRPVMRRQVQRLFDATGRAGMDLRVLPFGAGAHAAMAGSFTVFGFGADGRDPVVHSEDLTGGMLRARVDDVRTYRAAFAELQRCALSVGDSRAYLARLGDYLE